MGSSVPLMSPNDAYNMAPSRWTVINKVLNNKRALDMAFQQHTWEMQKQAKELASNEKRTQMAGEYSLKGREAASGGDVKLKVRDRAAQYATQILNGSVIKRGTPEYENAWVQTFNMALKQLQGEEENAEGMASGGASLIPGMRAGQEAGMASPGYTAPSRPSYAEQFQQKRDALKSKTTPSSSSGASGGYAEGTTIRNPKTGERMKFQGGKWVPIK